MKQLGFTHESTHSESQEWYTPPRIFDALGLTFDVDVASPGADIVPWIPAARHLTLRDDGLTAAWGGRIWLNPPYGADIPAWCARFARHGDGIMFLFARTDTAWFHKYAVKSDALCFLRGRVPFISGSGRAGGSPSCGSLLLANSPACVVALRMSGLGFVVEGARA